MSFPRYPKYKDSGVEWLGEVPVHWDVLPLKRRFQVVGGSTPRSDEARFWDGDVLWATPADLSKLASLYLDDTSRRITDEGLASCGTTLVPAGSIIISTRAPIGSVAIAASTMCTNQGCKSLVSLEGENARYFAQLLSISSAQLNMRGKGTTFLELSGDELGAFKVPAPPHEEQTAIAAFLDRETAKIDALVAEQQRLIELLKEKRQAVIAHAVTKGLNPNVPMKDSGIEWLGQIPAHWSLRELRHLIAAGTTITYGIVQAGPDTEGGVPYIRTSDMSGDALPMSGYLRTTHEIDAAYRRSKVSRNDLVVAIRASLGKGLLVTDHLEGANLTQGTARVSPGPGLLPKFLLRAFNSDYCQTSIRIAAKGTTFLEITLDELRRVPLAVPPVQEQAEIVESIDAQIGQFDHLIDEAERAAQLLQERRTALISAAVTGQIDVRAIANRSAA